MSKHKFNRNFAIIIGINDYVNGIRELETAVTDAHKLAQILQKQHQNLKQQYQAQNKYEVQLLLNKGVTFSKLKELIEDFKQGQIPFDNEKVAITESDRILFYFAGHGVALEALENQEGPVGYLIPQDATLGDSSTYLPMQELHDALNALPCRHMLAILDCCFAGAFRWASLKREIQPKVTVYKERYDRFISDAAWQVITSAADDQKALDSLGVRGEVKEGNEVHSPFAKALFDALRGTDKKADLNDDGIVTATELYSYLRDQVEVVTEKNYKRQTPSLCPLGKHDKGEFIFLLPNFDRDKLEDAPPLNLENNPYRGLQSYDEKDSNLFFGRDNLIKQLYQQVVSNKQTLTVVLGASGTGKSSLMKAGLLPCLRDSQEDKFQILDPMRPGETPLQALAQVCLPIATTITVAELAKDEQALANIIERWSQTNPQIKLLLAVDQFEELITLCKSDEQREQFQKLIESAIAKYPDKIHVVITLRLDFEGQFQTSVLKDFWNDDTRFVVPPMTQDEFREAIEKPASEKVVYFDPPSLVDELINEVVQMPGALPLLSFTLSELYLKYLEERRDNRALKKEDYEELGRVVGSLTKRANQEYDRLVASSPAYENTVRRVMLRMISLQGGDLARRQVPKSELIYADEQESDRVQTVIKRFSEARLIIEGSNSQGEPYVEPAHDALVEGWDKLLKWKKEEDIILQRRLTAAAEEWESVASKEQPSGLQAKAETVIDWLDRRLYVAENLFSKIPTRPVQGLQQRQHQQEGLREKPIQFLWNSNPYLDVLNQELQLNDNWFNQLETEFVQQSVLQKRRNISWRWRIAIAVILGLSGLTGWAVFSQSNALMGQSRASRETAEARLQEQGLDALISSLRAGRLLQHPLLQLFRPSEQLQNQVQGTLQKAVYTVRERNRLEGHQGTVRSSFSPNGQLLASAGEDGIVRLWNLQGQEQAVWNTNLVRSLSFSPNGHILATAGKNSTIRLWNLQGQQLAQCKGHQQPVSSVSFSPDGQLLVSGGQDKTVRLWNLQGQQLGKPFTGHQGRIWSVQFSPDAQQVTSAAGDGTVRLWDLQGKELEKFAGHQGPVRSVSFSRDGQLLTSAGDDKTVRVWNLQGKQLTELGHQDRVLSINFSPDGQRVTTGGDDGIIRLGNLQGQQLLGWTAHQGKRVHSVSFSPDGQLMVSAGDDSNVRVWNLHGQQLTALSMTEFSGYPKHICDVSFSPDSKLVASVENNGVVLVWDWQKRRQLAKFSMVKFPSEKHFCKVSFSPDSKLLASAGNDGIIRVWNWHKQQLITNIPGHLGPVYSVAFSPDSQRLVSAGDDGTIRLWNLQGKPLQEFVAAVNFGAAVNSVAFSPDGKMIVSGDQKGNVQLWDWQNREQFAAWKAHQGEVRNVSFNKDGKILASAGDDSIAKLWPIQSFDELIQGACDRARDYLQNNPNVVESDRHLCNNLPSTPANPDK